MKKRILFIVLILSMVLSSVYGQNFSPKVYAGDITGLSYSDYYYTSSYGNGYFYCEFDVTTEVDARISHCGSDISFSYITLYDSNGRVVTYGSINTSICQDRELASLEKKNLPPGTYYILSEFNESGMININIDCLPSANPTGNKMTNAINVDTHQTAFAFSDTRNTNYYTNDYQGQSTKDVFYKFTLAAPMNITVSHCGSELSDTFVSLLNSSGTRIAYNNDYSGPGGCSNTRQSYLKMENLAAGTYYVVSEGYSSNGKITTQIEGQKNITLGVSANQNYIAVITPTVAGATVDVNNALVNIQYFDGLGRPMQSVQANVTPNMADLVSFQEYDVYGRESKAWLPATATSNSGAFVAYSSFTNKSLATYANEAKAYSLPVYENSPLSRTLEQYGPGRAWQDYGKAVGTAYLTNNNNYVSKLYTSTDNRQTVSLSQTSSNPNYNSGELFVTKQVDEDGNISYEFKDKLGQVILTRQMNGSIPHDTYYVYDKYGNLRAVLPPLAADNLSTNTWGESDTYLQRYAYLYKYDNRNRCIAKKLPGAEWIYYVYDKADRLIFTQDGEQRSRGEWLFSIPDKYGRVVLTGTCKNTFNYLSTPLANIMVEAVWAGTSGSYKGYNISGVSPTSPVKVLSAQYYDNYDFLALSGFSTLGHVSPESGFGIWNGANAKALLTGTYFAEAGSGSEQICSALYYDYRERLIQSQTTNHLSGKDSEFIGYNFSGQPLKTKTVHTASGKATQTEYYNYIYDHAGRLTKTEHRQGSSTATPTILAENTYDELGRLKTNKKGNLPASTYNYNLRSWMKSITGTLFNQTLYYNESYAGNTPRYNGNISAMSWKAGNETLRGYRFAYDGLSRLTKADYLVNGSLNDNYKVPSISYDKHGNIKTLQRWGKTSSGYGMVDNLTMDHIGNQLSYVTDAAVKTPDVTAGLNDFKDASSATSGEYTYNRNGAMSKDLNKGISNIAYNSLNLPTQLTINGVTNSYKYAADGTKLKVTRGSDVTDYVGNKIYENGSLKRILVDGGYIENGVYHFYIQDHQGNNRVIATGTGTVVQRNHYYPFGMTFGEIAATEQDKQAYKYNNKELDRKNGLNLYDYSARYMEPGLGRFTTMDPLAEKYYSISPYAYCNNNPIRFVDPTGTSTWVMRNDDGTYRVVGGDLEDGDNNIYVWSINDGNLTMGESIGVTPVSTSFYNSDDNMWLGTIDPFDKSGYYFMTDLFFNNPGVGHYMMNATKNGDYDFKRNGIENKKEDMEPTEYYYRGTYLGETKDRKPVYSSARDIGNMGAGFIAGRHDIPWSLARIPFDLLESYQNKRPSIEGMSTQNAEYYGWQWGQAILKKRPIKPFR
ncbi:DUF6443 domain-containing protein [Bacteroides sp. 51]|uniref:DUF6443 domain-containing protein n=1 Tax=Bacteroides sp. 51 TaxID=2302938 RepID=UPI0013D621A1|nr:DUF6443 domain-containing protein [Bacteroides sp. 51]NDV84258.1 RHS repeat-associated core domain-containing protein [Bacteroides sp. 51]